MLLIPRRVEPSRTLRARESPRCTRGASVPLGDLARFVPETAWPGDLTGLATAFILNPAWTPGVSPWVGRRGLVADEVTMRRVLIAAGMALVLAVAVCKRESPQEAGGAGDRADPGPAAPAALEPATGSESEPLSSPAPKALVGRDEIEASGKPAGAGPTLPGALAQASTDKTPETPRAEAGAVTEPAPAAPVVSPHPTPAVSRPEARPPLPDLRLLLTAADVAEVAQGRAEFQRATLPGVEADQDRQSLYFEPTKGGKFGFAIQVFREADSKAARQRWESAFATFPNATEVAPVAGSSFFAYWGEVLHVAFLQPHGNLVVIVSCGRTYCDSDALYALAKKVNSRIK